MYLNGIPIIAHDGIIELPAGSLVGGVTLGTIRIIGTVANPSLLPVSATIGDAYLIGNNLWVYSESSTWVDIGPITRPEGNIGATGVFKNIDKGSTANGGEAVRLATSGFENKDAFCTIDRCYFNNCKSDPEIVSIKCSSNTVKNCIFENNGSSKLVLRHTHRDIID